MMRIRAARHASTCRPETRRGRPDTPIGAAGRGLDCVVHLAYLVEVRGVSEVSGRQLVPPEGIAAGDDLYRQIFERNRTVQLLIDPATGRIVDANPAACRFYGYSREDLTTRKISDINALPPADVTDALARAASGV